MLIDRGAALQWGSARPATPFLAQPCCREVRDPRFESLSAGQYDESKFKKR